MMIASAARQRDFRPGLLAPGVAAILFSIVMSGVPVSKLASRIGLLRSLVVYYGQPWKLWRMRRIGARWIGRGSLAFDVGAHVGNRVAVWRSLGARVVAFEPQPAFNRFLMGRYGRDPHVTLEARALGEQEGEAMLHISERSPTLSTLADDWICEVRADRRFDSVAWNRTERVPVTTLDRAIEQYGLPAFCKIDVEGHETSVLKGLSQPLPALSFEFLPVSIARAMECVAVLERLGSYRYNWSLGEAQRFGSAQWVSADQICRWLKALPPMSASGDVYAELVKA